MCVYCLAFFEKKVIRFNSSEMLDMAHIGVWLQRILSDEKVPV